MDNEFTQRYELSDFILTLPSGLVYRGFDKKFKRNVLIKKVEFENIKKYSDDSNVKERFKRYIKNSAQLIHPNIVTTTDYYIEEDGDMFSVHEYFDIKNSIISKDILFDLNIKEKLNIALSLADAIEFSHNLKLLHQNLYIDSIFLTSGTLKVDHFDLRRYLTKNELLSELGYSNNIPPYIPPECLKNHESTVSGDIFQIGAFLYFIFCKEHPFGDTIKDENILKLKNSDYLDPAYYPDVDVDIANIIKKCLSKDPEKRYLSVSDIFQEIKNISLKLDTKSYDVGTYRFFIQDKKMFMQTNPKSKINIDEIEERLISENIYNYDIQKISQAVHLSTGEPIEIGEIFKKIDSKVSNAFDISISDDHMECYLKKISNEIFDPKAVTFHLKKNKVKFGLINQAIESIAQESGGTIKLVAKGVDPSPGEDAYTIFFFEKENIFKPREDEEGYVDFKNISVIQQVDKGDPLVLKIPYTKGIDGYDVFGNIIKATPGKDLKLPSGKNTYISADGLKLLSTTDGIVNFDNNKVNVIEIIIVDGDVNYSTGNISYKGDVLIRGDVLPDFKVVAGGDIKIRGVVEGAYIESEKGSILINSGVFGKNQTKIKALKNIKADFVQDSELIAGDTVEISNYTRNSRVSCKTFLSYKGMGAVQGSHIEATRLIDINVAGSKNYTKTSLIINQNTKNQLKTSIQDTLEKLDNLSKTINQLKLQIKKIILSHGTMENAILDNEYKISIEKLKKLENLQALLENRIESLQSDMDFVLSNQKEMIIIRRHLFRDIKIKVGSTVTITKDEYESKVIIAKDENDMLIFSST
ncbi:MAG: FapA family protein [Calditerrivibrio sp.]|nr:FapA family protein [Calditerrivibrio sp.]